MLGLSVPHFRSSVFLLWPLVRQIFFFDFLGGNGGFLFVGKIRIRVSAPPKRARYDVLPGGSHKRNYR